MVANPIEVASREEYVTFLKSTSSSMTTPSPTGKAIGDFKQTKVANVCLLFC
jgi:hypothetical protein